MESSLLWPASARARGFRPKAGWLLSVFNYSKSRGQSLHSALWILPETRFNQIPKHLEHILQGLQPQGYMILPSEDGIGFSLCHLRVLGQVSCVHFVALTLFPCQHMCKCSWCTFPAVHPTAQESEQGRLSPHITTQFLQETGLALLPWRACIIRKTCGLP